MIQSGVTISMSLKGGGLLYTPRTIHLVVIQSIPGDYWGWAGEGQGSGQEAGPVGRQLVATQLVVPDYAVGRHDVPLHARRGHWVSLKTAVYISLDTKFSPPSLFFWGGPGGWLNSRIMWINLSIYFSTVWEGKKMCKHCVYHFLLQVNSDFC